jgi:CRISPR-associated protein Cmx8
LSIDARGFRPAAAVIDIPQQAGLEFLEDLARLVERAAKKTEISDVVSSIEYLHLVKAGNNVKSMAAGRITPNPRLLDRYLTLVSGHRPRFRNPLFRASLMRWMLEEADVPGRSTWYRPMAHMMVERPWPLFVRCEKTPKAIPWFSADAVTRFQDVLEDYHDELEDSSMTNVQQPGATADKPKPPLEVLVYRLVQNFVRQKTRDKCGLEWDDFKDKKIKDEKTKKERVDVPKEYAEAKERVVSDAFLAMRSRREKDFVEYFTASICSVRRYLGEDEFCIVAKALLDQPEDVKTLTLLALSANS